MLISPVEFFAKGTGGEQEHLPVLTPRQRSGERLEAREGTQFEVPIWHLKLSAGQDGRSGVGSTGTAGGSVPPHPVTFIQELGRLAALLAQAFVETSGILDGGAWWQIRQQGTKREPILCHE